MVNKKKKAKRSTNMEIAFSGGPKDGDTMLVSAIHPPLKLRLAFPEWCNYYKEGESSVYCYDMETPWVSNNPMEPETS